nr:MAG TPA: hypothetical protein [Bacteriophage sp.]
MSSILLIQLYILWYVATPILNSPIYALSC